MRAPGAKRFSISDHREDDHEGEDDHAAGEDVGLAPLHGLDVVEDRDRHDLGAAGDAPPIISTTPNSPTVWAKPSTAPVRSPGLASGSATVQKARAARRASVAATSSGRSPTAAKALRIGWTTNGMRIDDRADDEAAESEGERARAPQPRDRAAGPVRARARPADRSRARSAAAPSAARRPPPRPPSTSARAREPPGERRGDDEQARPS